MHKNPNYREIEHFPIWECKNVLKKYKYNIEHRVHLKQGNTPQHFYGVHHPGQVLPTGADRQIRLEMNSRMRIGESERMRLHRQFFWQQLLLEVFALLDSARPYHAFNTTDIRHCNKEVMLAFRSIAVLNGVEIMFCSHF